MTAPLPALSDLVAAADLPPAIGPLAAGIAAVLGELRYDGLRMYEAPTGDAGRIELTVVSYERLGLDIGGADGVALVLQPDATAGQRSELSLALEWRWPVLAVAEQVRTDALPATADEWFDLFTDVFSIDPRDLLADALDTFFDAGADPVAQFVTSFEHATGSTLTIASGSDPIDALHAALASVDPDVGATLVEHLVTSVETDPAAQLVRLAELLHRWLGGADPATIVEFLLPSGSVTLERTAMAIEVPRSWLVPLADDGTSVPAPARAQLRLEAGRFRASTARGLELDGAAGFHLERASLLGTGLTVAVEGAVPAFGIGPIPPLAAADGRPDDFVGLVVAEAAVGLPAGWIADDATSTADLFVTDLVIGTGGVSGTVGLRGRSGTAGAEPGPLVVDIGGDGGIGLRFDHVDLTIERNAVTTSTFAGGIAIPGLADADGNQTVLAMSATLAVDGTFAVETSGEVHLGGGIRLGPGGTGPVLRAEIHDGTTDSVSFAVDGELSLPSADGPGGVQTIRVTGALAVERSASGTWSIDDVSIASTMAGLSWTLPGGLVLDGFGAAVSWSSSGGFEAAVTGAVTTDAGAISVAGRVAADPVDPSRVTIDGSVALTDVAVGPVHVVDGAAVLHAATHPAPAASVRLTGTAGLLPDDATPASPTVDDFSLAVEAFDATLSVGATGAALTVTSGTVVLPAALAPAAPGGGASIRPTAAIATDEPLVATLTGGRGHLAGAVVVAGLGTTIDGVLDATLDTARLTFSSTALPVLDGVFGSVTVPLPGGQDLVLDVVDATFRLDGLPTGTLALGQTVEVALGGGFALRIVGGTGTGADGIATGLTVTETGGAVSVRIDASLLVVVPSDVLALGDGGTLVAGGAGHLVIDASGPTVHLESAVAGGTFRLGGRSGLLVENASVTGTGLAHLLDPSPTEPVTFALTGMVQLPDGGPGLGLRNARLVIDGGQLPTFDLDGFDVAPGETLSAGGVVPVHLSEASLTFAQPLPFPERLAPTNLVIELSGGVMLPLGDGDGIGGEAEDLRVTFLADGTPQLSIDGIALSIAGVELGVLEIGGQIYLGGLSSGDPLDLFFAGRVGGKLSGTGVEVLAAFRLTGPIGGCIDVSLGPAGIPLGQTGILLTGIAGGVSFANTNGDPCDFRTYVQLGDDGRPVDTPDPSSSGATSGPHDPHAVPPATAATIPDDDELAFPAPASDCPPASMNILAQPHPDTTRYPDAVIYKFSAIDEATLHEFGITRDLVEGWGLTDAHQMAGQLAATIRAGIESLWPPVPAGLDAVADATDAALDGIEDIVAAIAEAAIAGVLDRAGGADDVYTAIVELAWAGMPVADVTVKLTGTFSYVGVSAFLSVTGGIVLSTTGAAGLVGSLNLLGIPVGTFKGFVTATDAQGMPNPALCGEVEAAVGPLSLGTLRMSMSCPGGVTGMADAIVDAAGGFSAGLVRNAIRRAAPRVRELPGYDDAAPHDSLGELTTDEAVAVLGTIVSNPPTDVAGFTDALVGLLEDLWDAFSPEILLAGSVQPKLFGLPLAGEVVGVSAFATKTELAGQFRFSPSAIVSYFLGNVLPPVDQASLGFHLALPDPVDALRSGMTGAFADVASLVSMMEEGVEHVLANATFTVTYAIAPFGLELADAQARLILPALEDHPDAPGSTWLPPEQRAGDLPSRSDVLAAAMKADLLGNPLWKGTPDQLATLDVGDADQPTGLGLRLDYFPHGGFVGAGYLALPRILAHGPPLELVGVIFDGDAALLDRATAMVELVSEWILTTVDVGSLSFAMPCPSLPGIADDIRGAMVAAARMELPDDPAGIFPIEHAFFRGTIDGRILGVPVGRADAEVVAADPATGRPAELRVSASIPGGSWLHGFVGSVDVEFLVTGTPAEPVADRFAPMADEAAARPGTNPTRLADLLDRAGRGDRTGAVLRADAIDVIGRAAGLRTSAAVTTPLAPRSSLRTTEPATPTDRMRRDAAIASIVEDAAASIVRDRGARLDIGGRTDRSTTDRSTTDRSTTDRPTTDRTSSDRPTTGDRRPPRDGSSTDGRFTARLPVDRGRPILERPSTGGRTDPARPDDTTSAPRPGGTGHDPSGRPTSPLGRDLDDAIAALADGLPKVSLHIIVDDLAVPGPLVPFLGVAAAGSAELHGYSIAFDPDHPGTTVADRVRRHGGIVLVGSFSLAACFGLAVDVDRVEVAVDAGDGLFPRLSASADGVDVTLPGGLPAMDDVDVLLVVPGGSTGWAVDAATFVAAGSVFGQALRLSLTTTGGVRRLTGSVGFDIVVDATVGPLREPFTNRVVIPALTVDATIDTTCAFDIRSGAATVTASGTFTWGGRSWVLPATTLTGSLTNASGLVGAVEAAVVARAQTIFAALVATPGAWIDGLADGLFAFGGDIAGVLADAYGATAAAGAELLDDLGWELAVIAAALADTWDAADDVVVSTLAGLGAGASAIATALHDGLGRSRRTVAGLLADVGHGWSTIATALESTFTMTATQMATALRDAGAAWDDVGAVLDDMTGLTATAFASAMESAGFDADDTGAALEQYATSSAATAAAALRAAGYVSDDVAQAIHDHFTTNVATAAEAFVAAGYAAATVARLLADVFDATYAQITTALLAGFDLTIGAINTILSSL